MFICYDNYLSVKWNKVVLLYYQLTHADSAMLKQSEAWIRDVDVNYVNIRSSTNIPSEPCQKEICQTDI